MTYSLIISILFLVNLNLPISIDGQTFKTGSFNVIQKDKDLPTASLNMIKSFQSDQSRCLLACNLNILCSIVIYNSNGWCILCQKSALNELINIVAGQETTVFGSQNDVSKVHDGLINYWPIRNNLRDYVGSSDMSVGSLSYWESVGFTQDRFNNPNGAIFMNPGYYYIPPGTYFSNSFSFLVWVKVLSYIPWSRIFDCGNGHPNDNIVVSISRDNWKKPYAEVFRGATSQAWILLDRTPPTNTWFHLAVVYDGLNLMLYYNGLLNAISRSNGPRSVTRYSCYIGRSVWYVLGDNPDASVCLDDLMIFNRALSPSEVKYFMNVNIF